MTGLELIVFGLLGLAAIGSVSKIAKRSHELKLARLVHEQRLELAARVEDALQVLVVDHELGLELKKQLSVMIVETPRPLPASSSVPLLEASADAVVHKVSRVQEGGRGLVYKSRCGLDSRFYKFGRVGAVTCKRCLTLGDV